jgi:hypothetical protein
VVEDVCGLAGDEDFGLGGEVAGGGSGVIGERGGPEAGAPEGEELSWFGGLEEGPRWEPKMVKMEPWAMAPPGRPAGTKLAALTTPR